MLRGAVVLGVAASACAFSSVFSASSTMVPRRSTTATRSLRTTVKMMDIDAGQVLAAAPGLVALGALLGKQGTESGIMSAVPEPATAPNPAKTDTPAPATASADPTGKPGDLILARANFKRWNDALQTKNAQTVANMYVSNELSFLPTVSPKHIKAGGKSSSTESYFVEFVKKNPFGTITDDTVDMYDGGNTYLHSGLYTFELGDADARTPVEARFSYVWRNVNGVWKISHHHSSVVPNFTPPVPDMRATARANFQRWNDALQTKNAQTVANLYVQDKLSFLPTVSPEHIKAGGMASSTEDYFVDFVQKNPFGTITDDSVDVYDGGNAYLHSGLYTFELGDADARTPVEARFSYVWRKVDGMWKISHHHSSVRPKQPEEEPAKAKVGDRPEKVKLEIKPASGYKFMGSRTLGRIANQAGLIEKA